MLNINSDERAGECEGWEGEENGGPGVMEELRKGGEASEGQRIGDGCR